MGYLGSYCLYPFLEKILKRDIRSKVDYLKMYFRLPYSEREHLIKESLIRVLDMAANCVPYYRELFKHCHFDISKVRKDLRYIHNLPLLTKEIILEQGDRLLNSNFSKDHLIRMKTGGSTGPSVSIYYNQEAADWAAAVNLVAQSWAGRAHHQTEVRLASRYPEVFPLKDRLKEHIKCFAMSRKNIFTHSFEEKSLIEIWKKLKKYKPRLLQGHPSTLYTLCLFLRKKKIQSRNIVQIFESTGETLDEKKRNIIVDTLGCKCINRYGNAEFGIVAYERYGFQHALMVIDIAVFPETIEVSEINSNEIVLTGLLNDAMPLIRYKTGDLGELSKTKDGFFFTHILGRVHDIVFIGNKQYPTHYIQDLLDRLGGIEDFQIEQISSTKARIKIVPSADCDFKNIENMISKWWDNFVEVQYIRSSELKRVGWQGKFRYLIS